MAALRYTFTAAQGDQLVSTVCSVDLASLPSGSNSTVQDFREYVKQQQGWGSVLRISGPVLDCADKKLCLSPWTCVSPDKYYIFGDSLYRHRGSDLNRKDSIPSNNLIAPLAALSELIKPAAPLLEVRAFQLPDPNQPSFQIYVKVLTGRIITRQVNATTTVAELKLLIEDIEGISPDQQKIVYEGKMLYNDDDKTMQDFGVKAYHTLILVLWLGGGRPSAPATHNQVIVVLPDGHEVQLQAPIDNSFTGKDLMKMAMKRVGDMF